jgi:DNA-directed RNA polymerase specialized sigma24 family protein
MCSVAEESQPTVGRGHTVTCSVSGRRGVFMVMPDRGVVLGDVMTGVDDGELFGQLYPELRRFAAVVAPWSVDPDDLLQEAVTRTLRRQPLTELNDAGTYLRVVMVRLAANERRRVGRERRRADTAGGESPPVEGSSALTDLLALAPVDRAVVYLTVVEGLSAAEAASRLGRTEAGVRMRRRRALRRLRAHLVDEEGQ